MEVYNEKEILQELKNPSPERQKKAFEVIVNYYSEKLYWQIRKMVLSHDDANDLLQNTFIKAWTNIDLFRGEAKLSTWLYKIAINECITFLNKQRALNNVSIDDTDGFLVGKLESDDYFDGEEAQLKLQQAILTLPDKQRLVFNMKYYEDMPYEEISEILGTSVGALKASYHHAVKKIEAFLTGRD
jgi:RNA polymerase sigma factor, sigma-70 family